MKQIVTGAAIAALSAGSLLADFSYQQTTKITGGAMQGMMRMAGAFSKQAREPIVATVIVKGHRMAHISARSTSIIDLDKETITEINNDKKTYSVMTFEQMKQMLEDMSKRASQGKTDDANNVRFKAAAKNTGQAKTIDGLNAKEVVITVTVEGTDAKSGQSGAMDITSDLWIAPVAGYEEIRNFNKLMASKLGYMPGQNMGMLAQRPDMAKGMADLYKEMAKVDGVPLLTVTRVGGNGTGAAPSSNSTPQANSEQQQNTARDAAAAGALGRLGIGGFGRHKKNTDDAQQQQSQTSQNGAQDSSGTLIETTTEASGFSNSPADASKFEVPAGYKQVEPDANRRGRRGQ